MRDQMTHTVLMVRREGCFYVCGINGTCSLICVCFCVSLHMCVCACAWQLTDYRGTCSCETLTQWRKTKSDYRKEWWCGGTCAPGAFKSVCGTDMIYLYSAGTQSPSIPQCIYAPRCSDLGAHQKAQITHILTHTVLNKFTSTISLYITICL